jgi:hypothetical protein
LNPTHKTKTGTEIGGRLLKATHVDQSNYPANQQQVLGFAVPITSVRKMGKNCWVKTILLSQTSMS